MGGLLKVLYYAVFGFVALLGAWFVVTSLFGNFRLWDGNPLYSKLFLLVAAAAAVRLLFWAYALGEQQGRWGAGLGVVVLSMVVFQVIMVVGAFVLRGGR
jgi:hypothetical protein